MILKKIIPNKFLALVWAVGLFTAGFFILQISRSAEAANTCGFNTGNKTGAFSLSSNCAITSGFEGIDTGDLTVAAGKQIVIGSNAALVLSPNSQLIISKPSNPAGAIVLTDNSSQIIKGSLCAQDADGDGYADKTAYSGQTEPTFFYATGNCPTSPVNYVKKGALNSLTQLDCVSNTSVTSDASSLQKIDCVKSRVNGEWTNVGTCGEYAAGIQKRTRVWSASVDIQADCGGADCGSLSGTEDDYTLSCGPCTPGATKLNYCGEGDCARTQEVTCTASGTWPTDCTPGTAENDATFCSRLGKDCDSYTGIDNCLATRTANCGTCASPHTCGGSGTANVCSCTSTTWTPAANVICTPETGGPAAFTQTSDCGNTRQAIGTQVCCINGYRDYDKDGYGAGDYACYAPSVNYDIVSNANDCSDSNSSIYPGIAVTSFCGVGSCGSSGTDTCDATGGTWTITAACVTSTAACCETNGTYKATSTPVSTCQKCTGSSATPVNQTSSEDLGDKCTAGVINSATVCQSNYCSGAGDYCGYVSSGTTCRSSAGTCDSAETCTGSAYTCPIDSFLSNSTICSSGSFNTPVNGSCQRTAVDTKCSGSDSACNGATVNRYENASTAGYVWNGSAWAAASATNNCTLGSYLCSTQQIYQNYYGCNTSGTCDTTTSKGTTNGAACTGTEISRCAAGSGSCQNLCSDGIDNDGNGYTDSADSACGAVCTSGDCCDTTTGQYKTAGMIIGTCKKCTGTSNTSVYQTSSEDLGGNCTTGAAGSSTACQSNYCSGTSDSCGYVSSGTTCRSSAGTCDSAETCTGSAYTCPIDSFLSNSTICSAGSFNTPVSGSCQRTAVDTKCSGSDSACNGATAYRYENASTAGYVWNGSAWAAASAAMNCGFSGYLCSTQQIYQNYYGCSTGGTCDTATSRGTSNGSSCGGGEKSRCVAGNGACQDLCSDGIDNDGDGYTDSLDTDCGAQCTSGNCCDTATGLYKPANTVIGTCQKCTGSSATAINQTSSEDLGNKCVNGADGSSTACQSNTCSGAGDYCGYVSSGTTCRSSAGTCDAAETCTGSAYTCPIDSYFSNTTVCLAGSFNNPASGSCQRTATDTKCSGSDSACNGATAYRYENASTAGYVWNGSAWAAASASNNCSLSSYLCSAKQIYQNYYGCSTGGSCDTATSKGTVNGTACSYVEGTSVCVAGVGTCQSNCSDGTDNDGDGYIDAQDAGCGGYEQCTSGDCCNTATGQFKAANTLIGTCKKCSGSSATSVYQTSSEDLGSNCTNGANGSSTACQSNYCSGTSDSCGYVSSGATCRPSAGTCDAAETCTGSAYSCPIDSYYSSSTVCSSGSFDSPASGSCQRTATDTKCTGTGASCNGATAYRYDYAPSAGYVWNGSGWISASTSVYCSVSGYLCNSQRIYQSMYGCNTSGSCDTATSRATLNGSLCSGESASSQCVSGYGTCQDNCSDGIDNDGDSYIDNLDPGCGAQCTSGDCCDTSTGQYKAANTVIGTCLKCTGSSATAVNQTSVQDLGGNCTTGAAGSSTSCQSNTCSGSGDYCGYVSSGTTCRASAGACDSTETCTGSSYSCPIDSFLSSSNICSAGSFNTPASGACQRTATDQYCSGSAASCSGSTNNRYDNGSSGQVWNGSAWASASGSVNCGFGGYLCGGQQIYRNYYGCTGSGSCSTTAAGSSNGTLCTGGENNMCVAGACQSFCTGGYDDDSDGYTDTQDIDCNGYSQCTSGNCCNTTTGGYTAAGCLSGCLKCTGSSATAVAQTSSEDLCNNCTTGGLNSGTECKSGTCSGSGDSCGYLSSSTVCRSSDGLCDPPESCTGSAFACPIDTLYSSSHRCDPAGSFNNPASGSCQRTATDYYCDGLASDTCDGPTVTRYEYASAAGQVWNGSAWAAASCSLSCSSTLYCSQLCSGGVAKANIFNDLLINSAWALGETCPGGYYTAVMSSQFGCSTSGTCNTNTVQLTCEGATCTNGCLNGACTVCTPGATAASDCNRTGSCAPAVKTCNANGTGWSACSVLPDTSGTYYTSPLNGSYDRNCDGTVSIGANSTGYIINSPAYLCSPTTVQSDDAAATVQNGIDCDQQYKNYGYNGVYVGTHASLMDQFSSSNPLVCETGMVPTSVTTSSCGQTFGYPPYSGWSTNPYGGHMIAHGYASGTYCSSNNIPLALYMDYTPGYNTVYCK